MSSSSGPVVSHITVYPVKSCQGVDLESVTVGATGFEGDRRWQVVDGDGAPLTQRDNPLLAAVAVAVRIADGGLVLSAPEQAPLELEGVDGEGGRSGISETEAQTIFGVTAPVVDAGEQAASWITSTLGRPARLVAAPPEAANRLPGEYDIFGAPIAFADAAPLHLTSATSLRWLVDRAKEPFDMRRFRPNLVVDGAPPWVEDTWSELRIGEAQIGVQIPWPRCPIPQIDQSDGTRHEEPALVLRQHRWCSEAPRSEDVWRPLVEGNALFGLGCTVGPVGARIAVGDSIEVVETTEPLIAAPVSD